MTDIISDKTAFPVTIGTFTLFCESFTAARNSFFSETASVSGSPVQSGCGQRSLRITLKGRVYDETSPCGFLVSLDGIMCLGQKLSITYRDAVFSDCTIVAVSAEDKGEDFSYAAVTLVTQSPAALISQGSGDAP